MQVEAGRGRSALDLLSALVSWRSHIIVLGQCLPVNKSALEI